MTKTVSAAVVTVAQKQLRAIHFSGVDSFSHPVPISYAFCSHHGDACRG